MSRSSRADIDDDIGTFLGGELANPDPSGDPTKPIKIKIVVVGNGAVGKTSLLQRFFSNFFNNGDYIMGVFDNYSSMVERHGVLYEVDGWDTAGQEDYDRLRPLSYPETDVFLVCYDIANRSSFENVPTKWLPEILEACPMTPFVLVGCKLDLREDFSFVRRLKRETGEDDPIVSSVEGRRLAHKVLATNFYECSSKEDREVTEVFHEAIRIVLMRDRFVAQGRKVGFFDRLFRKSSTRKITAQEALGLYRRLAMGAEGDLVVSRELEMEKAAVRKLVEAEMADARKFFDMIGSRLSYDVIRHLLYEFHVVDLRRDVSELVQEERFFLRLFRGESSQKD